MTDRVEIRLIAIFALSALTGIILAIAPPAPWAALTLLL
jgi:hypothetical protein